MISLATALRFGPYVAIGGLLVATVAQCETIDRKNETIETRTQQRDDAREGRIMDRATYRATQARAQQMEEERLVKALAKQQEIHDATLTRYQSRLAGLDAHLGRLRSQAPTSARRAGGGEPVSRVPSASGGADGAAGIAYAPCDRECLAALIRYDELITWLEEQAASSQ